MKKCTVVFFQCQMAIASNYKHQIITFGEHNQNFSIIYIGDNITSKNQQSLGRTNILPGTCGILNNAAALSLIAQQHRQHAFWVCSMFCSNFLSHSRSINTIQ